MDGRFDDRSYKTAVRLVATSTGCILCGGLVPVWRLVQPHLVTASVFANDCLAHVPLQFSSFTLAEGDCASQEEALSNVFIVGVSSAMLAFWPTGYILDYAGPWVAGTLGAGMTLLGMLLTIQAVAYPMSKAWWLYMGALLQSVGPLLNAYGVLGFLWEYPENQGMVLGAFSAALAFAVLLPLVFLYCFSFKTALYLVTFDAAAALIVSAWATPSYAEYQASMASNKQGKPPPSLSMSQRLKLFRRFFNLHFMQNVLFFATMFFSVAVQLYYNAISSPYLEMMLNSKKEAFYVNLVSVLVTGIVGVVTAPLGELISDSSSMHFFLKVMTVINIVMTPIMVAKTENLQIWNNVLQQLLGSLGQLFALRWFSVYAPPENFGEFQGLSLTGMGVVAYPCCSALQSFSSTMNGIMQFDFPLILLQGMSAVFCLFFAYHMYNVDFPESPPNRSDLDSDEDTALLSSSSARQAEQHYHADDAAGPA